MPAIFGSGMGGQSMFSNPPMSPSQPNTSTTVINTNSEITDLVGQPQYRNGQPYNFSAYLHSLGARRGRGLYYFLGRWYNRGNQQITWSQGNNKYEGSVTRHYPASITSGSLTVTIHFNHGQTTTTSRTGPVAGPGGP